MQKVFLFVFLFSCINRAKSQTADIIFFNGKIFTSDTVNLYVDGLAISGNRIMAAGNYKTIGKFAGKQTQRIDLLGKTVVPGFNDAHYHLEDVLKSYKVEIKDMNPSWAVLSDSLKNIAEKLPGGSWIEASIGPSIANAPSINRFSLDSISADHPIRLLSYWGHVGILNSLALHLMGITDTQQNPKGARFERIKGSKTLSGRCFEKNGWAPQFSYPIRCSMRDERGFVSYLQRMSTLCLSLGITSLQNMCTGATAPDYLKFWKIAGLPLRLRLIRWADLSDEGDILIPGVELSRKMADLPLATVSGTKWLLDGTPIEGGACLTKEYPHHPAHFGYLNYSYKEIESFLREAVFRNDQICIHAAGDSSIEVLFDIMETINTDWKSRRTRLEHGDALLPAQFETAKRLGIVVLQNPSHFDDVDISNLYHENLAKYCQRFQSLLNKRIPVAIGTDGLINPFVNIMFSVTHRSHPDERVTVEEAVIAYTRGSAYAEFAENEKGTLTPGQLADLTVLSQDIFTIPIQQLPGTRSVLTMVDGKIVFKE